MSKLLPSRVPGLTFRIILILIASFGLIVTIWHVYRIGMFPIKSLLDNPLKLTVTKSDQKEKMHVSRKRIDSASSYTADNLPRWDYTTLINITGFDFLIENTVCKENETVDLLVAVHSAPHHVDRRKAIRETWGQPNKGWKVLFFIGAVDNQTKQDKLDIEDNKYKDLIQGNFEDAYTRLAYKDIMIFKYAIYYCPKVKFILKIDDDVYVNLKPMYNYLMKNITDKNVIMGNVRRGERPTRDKSSRWFASYSEFATNIYPTYCQGFAIIYSYEAAFKIYREAQRTSMFFRLEDVFISGILAHRTRAKHLSLPKNAQISRQQMLNAFRGNFTGISNDFWYGPIQLESKNLYELWEAVKKRHDKVIVSERVPIY